MKGFIMDAVVLNRISSAQQTDGYSLEAQEKHGGLYAKEKGFHVLKVWTFQETASNPEHRHKFQEVLTYIDDYNKKNPKRKLIVIVEKPDRLYRNHQDKEWCQQKYLSGQAEFHFYKDRRVFNEKSSPADIFYDDMMTSLNKYASGNIGREATKGMREKAAQGWFPGKAPIGYLNTTTEQEGRKQKIITIDPETKRLVQMIFSMRAEGKSFEEIRLAVLHSDILPPNKVNLFKYKSGVEFIVKNQFYSGHFEWKGEWFEGKHELIVAPDVYAKALNIEKRIASRMNQNIGLFSNWLTCICGCKVTFDPKIKKLKTTGEMKTYNLYRCSNGKRAHEKYPYMDEKKIMEELGKAVEQITITGDLAKDIAFALNETHRKASEARKRDMEGYKVGLKGIERAEDQLYEDHKKGILNEEAYKRQIEKVRTERDRFTSLLDKAQSEIENAYFVTAKKILELAKNAKELWFERNMEERRDFLEKILSNQVFDAPSVRYELKKPFRILSEMASSGSMLRLLDSNQRPGD